MVSRRVARALPICVLLAVSCSGAKKQEAREPVVLIVGAPPMAGVAVTIHDGAGVVLETMSTNSAGTAVFDVPALGSFTVYYDELNGTHAAIHVLDPESGSTWSLPVAALPVVVPPPLVARADITLSPAPPTATGATVFTACESVTQASLTVLNVAVGCDGASTAPEILAIAHDSAGQGVTWGSATGVPVTPGATVALTLGVPNSAFEPMSLSVINVPGGHKSVALIVLKRAHLDFFTIVTSALETPTNVITARAPQGFATHALAGYFVLSANDTESFGESRFSATPAAVLGTADVASFPLARVFFEALDGTNPARPSVAWTRGAGTAGTVARVSFRGRNANLEVLYHDVLFDPASLSGPLTLAEVPDALAPWRADSFPVGKVEFLDGLSIQEEFSRTAYPALDPADGVYHYSNVVYAP